MKVWIGKYALSGGIEECDGEDAGDGYFRPGGGKYSSWALFRFCRDAHETREAAVKAADQMRLKKIASLKKQIAKLEAMKFE